MTYHGHKNWSHWNVALWIANDEPTYRRAVELIKASPNLETAARWLLRDLPDRTPDGAPYSKSAVRAALSGLKESL